MERAGKKYQRVVGRLVPPMETASRAQDIGQVYTTYVEQPKANGAICGIMFPHDVVISDLTVHIDQLVDKGSVFIVNREKGIIKSTIELVLRQGVNNMSFGQDVPSITVSRGEKVLFSVKSATPKEEGKEGPLATGIWVSFLHKMAGGVEPDIEGEA